MKLGEPDLRRTSRGAYWQYASVTLEDGDVLLDLRNVECVVGKSVTLRPQTLIARRHVYKKNLRPRGPWNVIVNNYVYRFETD